MLVVVVVRLLRRCDLWKLRNSDVVTASCLVRAYAGFGALDASLGVSSRLFYSWTTTLFPLGTRLTCSPYCRTGPSYFDYGADTFI